MTPEERQAMRMYLATQTDGTHYEGCWKRHGWCAVAYLLDATEPVSETDPKLSDCDNNHIKYREVGIYLACPKCGEKL